MPSPGKISQQYEIMTEKAIQKIAAMGIPGVIVLIAVEKTELSIASIIAVVLSLLGGPVTFIPTIALVTSINTIKFAIKYRGFDEVLERVLIKLEQQGIQVGDVVAMAESYPLPKSLKIEVKETLAALNGKDNGLEDD